MLLHRYGFLPCRAVTSSATANTWLQNPAVASMLLTMRLQQVLTVLRQMAPEHLAEPWDQVGLHVGDSGRPGWPVRRAMLCIDLTEPVLAEAVSKKVNLVVAYHPPIFEPLERLTADDWKQRMVLEAARRRIAVYSPHTALDAANGGVNDWLCEGLGRGASSVIRATPPPAAGPYKVVTFLPHGAADNLRRHMAAAGAGRIGDYEQCSYNLDGFGTFIGGQAAHPTVGRRGRLETVRELRIEMVCPACALPQVVAALLKAHPYEEPAFDVYPLEALPRSGTTGQGRVLRLDRPVTVKALVGRIKKRLGVSHLEVALPQAKGPTSIRTIGLCAGAGGSLLAEAGDVDLFFTGEMRHHDVLTAVARGIAVILAGHTQTERPYLSVYRDRIARHTPGIPWSVSRWDRAPAERV